MLCKVIFPNDYFPVGAVLEEQDGDVQAVKAASRDGRLATGAPYGFAFPYHLVRPYVVEIRARGLDVNIKTL